MARSIRQYLTPLGKIRKMILNFRKKYPNEQVLGHVFKKEYVERILNQANCEGIRIYYALDENGKRELIIMGIDSENNDIFQSIAPAKKNISLPEPKSATALLSPAPLTDEEEDHTLFMPSMPCPDMCGQKNIL